MEFIKKLLIWSIALVLIIPASASHLRELSFEAPTVTPVETAAAEHLRALDPNWKSNHLPNDSTRMSARTVETYRTQLDLGDDSTFLMIGAVDHPIYIYLDSTLLFARGSLAPGKTSTFFDAIAIKIPNFKGQHQLVVQIFPRGARLGLPHLMVGDYVSAGNRAFWQTLWNYAIIAGMGILIIAFGILSFSFWLVEQRRNALYLKFALMCFAFPLGYVNVIFSAPALDEAWLWIIARIGFIWASAFLLQIALHILESRSKWAQCLRIASWTIPSVFTLYFLSCSSKVEEELVLDLASSLWLMPSILASTVLSLMAVRSLRRKLYWMMVAGNIAILIASVHDYLYFLERAHPFCWWAPYSFLLQVTAIGLMMVVDRSLAMKELKENNQLLENTNTQLRQISQARNALIRALGHEIRTPTNALMEHLDTIDPQRTSTSYLLAEALALHAEDIIAVASLHEGTFEAHPCAFDPKHRIGQMGLNFKAMALQKQQVFNLDLQSLPIKLIGDIKRTEQILYQIFDLVLHKNTGTELVLQAQFTEGHLELSLIYKGDLLDKEIKDYEGHGLRWIERRLVEENHFLGTGQLALLGILEKLGGHFVSNQVLELSYFGIRLPMQILEEAEPPRDRSFKILAVDDQDLNLKVISKILLKLGHQCIHAKDGQQAIDRIHSEEFDLVLMDVQMPVLDGLEATRRVRQFQHFNKLPIVGLTAHAERSECLAAGMNDMLSKPVKADEVQNALTRWIVNQVSEEL